VCEVRTEIPADKWEAEVVREVSPEEKVIRRSWARAGQRARPGEPLNRTSEFGECQKSPPLYSGTETLEQHRNGGIDLAQGPKRKRFGFPVNEVRLTGLGSCAGPRSACPPTSHSYSNAQADVPATKKEIDFWKINPLATRSKSLA
jgi:hypothetical protein